LASLRSTRGGGNVADIRAEFNGSSTGYTAKRLYGDGSSAGSDNSLGSLGNAASQTANTFSSHYFYIPNYTSSSNKSFSLDSAAENNATGAYVTMSAYLWSNTAAITSVLVRDFSDGNTNNLVQYSTATLYGISRTTSQIKATGGTVYDDASYVYHLFTSSGTFTPSQALTADVLVVAGGGQGGAAGPGGGGGAGGLIGYTNQSLTAQNYTVTVGAGSAKLTDNSNAGATGNNSQFGSLTAASGGGGGGGFDRAGGQKVGNGGSGGGGGPDNVAGSTSGGTGTAGQGNNGGQGNYNNSGNGGGGGGAGGVGGNGANPGGGGAGGVGSSTYSSWGAATGTGQLSGGVYYFAGGGGGAGDAGNGAGGLGGGGAGGGSGTAGLANTGGGGSGAGYTIAGEKGGSGIVIVRYAK